MVPGTSSHFLTDFVMKIFRSKQNECIPNHDSACGLTVANPPDQLMLQSKCIYNDVVVDMFVANLVEID